VSISFNDGVWSFVDVTAYRAFKYVALDTESNNGEAKPFETESKSYEGRGRGIPLFEKHERWGPRQYAPVFSPHDSDATQTHFLSDSIHRTESLRKAGICLSF
jgi:hypothetical protein